MRSRNQQGFTIVEVLVAAMILVVGLLGTLALIDGANLAATGTKAREGGTNLQRELVEVARSVPYDELVQGNVVAAIRSRGLADSTVDGTGWTVVRRGIRYTISVGVCSVDDPSDLTGNRDANRFCATGVGNTSPQQCRQRLSPGGTGSGALPDCGVDTNADGAADAMLSATATCAAGGCGNTRRDYTPDDYKRIVTLVRWDRGAGNRFSVQTATYPNPGFAAGPRVTNVAPQTALQNDTVTSQGATSLPFTVTTNRQPAAVYWFVDGQQMGTAAMATPTSWTFTWNHGAPATKPDGTYVITAQAVDAVGVTGASRAVTIKLNRRVPPAVALIGGRNNRWTVAPTNLGRPLNELQWTASVDGDIDRYEISRRLAGSSGAFAVVGSTSDTEWYDALPAGGMNVSVEYQVRALDTDVNGVTRQGAPSNTVNAGTTSDYPRDLTLTNSYRSGDNVHLVWDLPNQDLPDFIRIYRRPAGMTTAGYQYRYDTVEASQTSFVDTKTNGVQHVYWVTGVSPTLGESILRGPVQR